MIKPFLLRTALAILAFSVAMASQPGSNAQDDLQTPQRTAISVVVEPTPGQRVCQRQAQIITRENFIAVVDPQIVDGWGVDWSVFQNTLTSIDDPARTRMMRLLNNKLTALVRTNFNEEFMNFVGHFDTIRRQIEAVHGVRLDTVAMAYFSQFFSQDSLSYQPKKDGVQLGERIIVQRANQPPLTYHVKTHSAGRLSSNSTAAKLVNPQELMAYRILQRLGVGCETHFFQRSPEDVYIATLDAGTGGTFTLFEVMSGHLGLGGDGGVGLRLAGNLINIAQDPSKLDHANIESVVNYDPVAKNFIRQMVTLDIITRVCRLHDLLNNPGNFGFFETNERSPNIRVIDFRIADDPTLKMSYDHWGGFLEGNGLYQYAGSHKTMRYVIHDRPRQARVEEARNVMQVNFVQALKESIQRANQDVSRYLDQDVFAPHHAELVPKLQAYHQALLHNVDFFVSALQKWQPESTDAAKPE